jgi:hypothetical protein
MVMIYCGKIPQGEREQQPNQMEKSWDNSLSILVNSNPQVFLDLFLPGAILRQQHHTKLKGTQRQPDVVLEVDRCHKQ